MMTFIIQGGEGRGKTNKKRKATKSKGRGLEEGASRALSLGRLWVQRATAFSLASALRDSELILPLQIE